jgi:hypothetical protein
MMDPDEYLDDPKMRKFGRLSRQMQREWRDGQHGEREESRTGRETGTADQRDEDS